MFNTWLFILQEELSWGSGSRGQGLGSPRPGMGASPGGRLERTPSFTAEWDEVRSPPGEVMQLELVRVSKLISVLLRVATRGHVRVNIYYIKYTYLLFISMY